MGRSIGLALYLMVAERWTGFAKRTLRKRLRAGKEDPERIDERRGIASIPRPKGPLIWFHAASVGESLSLVDLMSRLRDEDPSLNVLITTGTKSSAALLVQRLPEGVVHQYVPLDVRPYIRSFLDHWRPSVAVWTESELWPALIHETKISGCSLVLLNARISEASVSKWRWNRGAAKSLLRRFDHILTQDEATKSRLLSLGADPENIRVNGSLKQGASALPHDAAERARLAAQIDARPVWLAASTHPGEEELVVAANDLIRRVSHRLLVIIAPRHPERGDEIAERLRSEGRRVMQRSKGEDIGADTEIYLADTLGEMGLWYRIAPVTFLGGSLVPIGGHNPFEPAALGSAIVHGPHVASAQEVYDALHDAQAARQIADQKELAETMIDLLEPHKAAQMAHNAWEVSSSGAKASDGALTLLQDLLDQQGA